MTRALLILILCFILGEALAQADTLSIPETDTLSTAQRLLKENQTAKLRKKIKKTQGWFSLGSLKKSAKQKTPNTARLDTLRDGTFAKTKGVQSFVAEKTDTINSLKQNIQSKQQQARDVVNKPVNQLNAGIQSIENKITQPVDSIQNAINKSVTNLEKKINAPADSITQLINSNVRKITDATGIKAEDLKNPVKDLSPDAVKLPGQQDLVPSLSTDKLNVDQKLPDTKIGDIEGLDELKEKANEVKQMPKDKLKDVPGIEQAQKINGKISALDQKLDKVEKLEDDVKQVAQGKVEDLKNAPDQVEKQLLDKTVGKELTAQSKKIQEQQEMIQRYKDRKLLEQELRSKALALANDKAGAHKALINKAAQSYEKERKLFGNFQSLKDLPKRPPNEMKGLSFRKRTLPGLNLQVYQSDQLFIDLMPQVGFRFTTRLTVGIGGTYRIGIQKSYDYFVEGQGVFGGRVYSDFMVAKGFFLHGDGEYLNASKSTIRLPEPSTDRILASNFGIGKSYNISRRFKGSALALYRVEYFGHLTGQKKFNLRVGFDYVLSKKKKKY